MPENSQKNKFDISARNRQNLPNNLVINIEWTASTSDRPTINSHDILRHGIIKSRPMTVTSVNNWILLDQAPISH